MTEQAIEPQAEPSPTPPTEPPAAEPPAPAAAEPAGIPATVFQQRVDELTAQRYAERRRADELQAELVKLQARLQTQPPAVAPPGSPPTYPQALADISEEAIARQADLRAREIVRVEDFNKQCNVAAVDGAKTYGEQEFGAAVRTLHSLGAMQPEFLEAALATGEGPKVIFELGKDPAKAMELLRLPASSRAVALAKLAIGSLAAPASKAPAPVRPTVGGGSGPVGDPVYDPSVNTRDWMEKRTKDVRARAEASRKR